MNDRGGSKRLAGVEESSVLQSESRAYLNRRLARRLKVADRCAFQRPILYEYVATFEIAPKDRPLSHPNVTRGCCAFRHNCPNLTPVQCQFDDFTVWRVFK